MERRLSLRGARVLVLGAGGAARAAVYGLVEKGAHVSLWSRKEAAARELAASAGAGGEPVPRGDVVTWLPADLPRAARDAGRRGGSRRAGRRAALILSVALMCLGSLMIAARGHGLHTCPQAAFADFHKIIRPLLNIPEKEVIICGMALGHIDPDAAVNRLVTERASLADYASFDGF